MGFCLLYRPITGSLFDGFAEAFLYPWFFYPVPEVLPALVVLYLMWPKAGPQADESSKGGDATAKGNGLSTGVDGTESDGLLSGGEFDDYADYGGYGDVQTAASSASEGAVEVTGTANSLKGRGSGGRQPSLVKRGPLAGTIWV